MRTSDYAPAPSALENSSTSYRDMVAFLDRHRIECRAAGDTAGENRAGQLLKYIESNPKTVIFGGVKYTLIADRPSRQPADGSPPTDRP